MSQSGLALLTGRSRQALIKLEDTLVTSAPSESLKPFVGKGLTLVTKGAVIDGKDPGNLRIYKSSFCAAVLKHYSDIERANQEDAAKVATYSLIKFAEKGVDRWIQDITGWTEYKNSVQLHTQVYTRRINNMRDHDIDDEFWCIFREGAEVLLTLEQDWQVPIDDFDLLDGSIGKKWREYRRDQPWAESNDNNWYTHNYRDHRGPRPARAYRWSERAEFGRWLIGEYIPKHLPQYLVYRYGKSVARLIYTEQGLLTDEILQLTEVKRKSPKDEALLQRFFAAREQLQRIEKGE